MGYIDALKKKGSSEVNVAASRVTDLKKAQNNKCAKCKKDLRSGYYKTVKNETTNKNEIVCSDCLVKIAKKH